MDPTTTSTQGEKPIILQIEIWQSQSYGAIKGWKIPSRSTPPHYTCSLFPNGGSENFPEDLNPPSGWDWHDKWTIDTSNAFGQSDSNGWYFGPTFEKLTELLETNSATGISSKSSMVRMRRWVRSIVCTSIDLQKKITSRIEEIIQQRKHVENIYKDKEEAFKSIKFYEENRSFVFAQSLHLATQGILNTLSILKELINKLKLLKQFLGDRIEMEKQHASSLDALAKRYWLKSGEESEETTPRGSANRMLERQASLQKLIEEQPTTHETSAAPTSIPSSSDNGVLQCANIFFSGIHRATEAVCNSKSAFATNLLLLMNNEVSELLTEVQTVLKEARATFRKNSDICRLSESAIINFSSSLQIAFDSVASFAMEEIALLTNELTILRGGSTFQPHIFEQLMKPPADDDQANLVNPSFHATSNLPPIIMSSPSVRTAGKRKKAQREDMWLSVQRYKVAVRDSQEALCVLISESMDLELQQQILTNRVHNMFVYVIDNYLTEELTLSSDTDLIYTGLMKSIQEKIETIGVPNPILQSPFAKLNPALSMLSGSQDSFKGEEGGGGVQNNASDEAAKEYEDFINSVGIFSFTTLFKEPLPVNPGVIKSGYLLTVRPSELLFQNNHHDSDQTASESKVPDSITVKQLESSKLAWREAYVVATSDGYLHIIYGRKSEIPARSFYMKNSYLNEYVPSLPIEELREKIFEIFMMATAVQQTKKNGSVRKGSARIIEGLYLQTNSSDEKKEWIYALKNLTNLPSHVDKVIEEEASVSMLESLPILKGETTKIDLEMKNYEKYQQENRPVTLSSASRLQSFSIENNHRDDYMNRAEAMATSFTSPFAEKGNDGIVGSDSGSVEKEGVSEEAVDKEEERKTENDTVRRENQRPDSKTGSMDNEEEDTGLQLQTNFSGKYGSQNDSDSDVASPSPFNLLHHLSPDQRNQIAEEKDRRAITIKTNNSSDSNSLSPLNNIQFAGSDDIGFFTSQSEDRQTSDENDSFYHYSKSYFHLPNEKLLPALFESVEEEHEDEQKDSLHHEAHKEEGKQEEVKEEVITQEAEVPQKKEGKTEISEIDEDNTLPPLPTGYSLIDKTTEKKESDAAETGNSEADFFNTNLNLHYETDSDDDSSTGLEANRRFRPQAQSVQNLTFSNSPYTVSDRSTTPTPGNDKHYPSGSSGSRNKLISSQSGSKSAYGGFDYSATSKESWIKYDNNRKVFEKSPTNPGSSNNLNRPPSVGTMLTSSTSLYKPTQSQLVGMVPVQSDIKPKQIIPLTDSKMPLARRHSQMIKQYEQGLEREKQKASLKVKESKREHLAEVIDLVIDPATLSAQSDSHSVSSASNKEMAAAILRSSSPAMMGEINATGYNNVTNTIHDLSSSQSRTSSFASLTELAMNSIDSHTINSGGSGGGGIAVSQPNSYDDNVDQLLPNLVTGKKIVKRLTEKFDSQYHQAI